MRLPVRLALLLGGLVLPAAAQDADSINSAANAARRAALHAEEGPLAWATTTVPAHVLARPDVDAEPVADVPDGAAVAAYGFDGAFWAVRYNGVYGFLPSMAVASPVRVDGTSLGGLPGAGASTTPEDHVAARAVAAQCSGTTKQGARCKRRTRSATGRCHQHGL